MKKIKSNDSSFFITKIPLYLVKGFIVLSYLLYSTFKYILKYLAYGYVTISYFVYMILAFPFKTISRKSKKDDILSKRAKKAEELRLEKEKRAIEKKRRILEKQEKKEKKFIKKHELEVSREKERKKKEEKEGYLNENVQIEKHDFKWFLNALFTGIVGIPKKIKDGILNIYHNSTLYKNARNKEDINRQALLLNFEGDDALKSEVKIVYEYVAKDQNGKTIKGYFDAFSKVEVHSYLLSEGYEVYSIRTSKWIQFVHGSSGRTQDLKVKIKHLIFMLTQLSTYIKAGIPLVDSLKILAKQYKQKSYQKIFSALIYDLSMGDSFSDALAKQGEAFPRLLINMVKASELTGELPEALDDMADYYTETESTKKQMISALTYPAIVLVFAIAVMGFVMLYVIPKFVTIYESFENTKLPAFTVAIINLSAFLKKNLLWVIIAIIIFVLIFRYLYKNVKVFRIGVQWTLMHIQPMKSIIIYNEVTLFTKTFASLLKHTVFITDSMEILNKMTNNEIYKSMILDTITNLAKGEKISKAFENSWAFPVPAYEMIVTGEKTGQLAEMMQKVSEYYQDLHKNAIARLKAFVEPILIVGLTFCVGIIVLAVIIPMFDLYRQIELPS